MHTLMYCTYSPKAAAWCAGQSCGVYSVAGVPSTAATASATAAATATTPSNLRVLIIGLPLKQQQCSCTVMCKQPMQAEGS